MMAMMTLQYDVPVTGQQVIDAVSELAGENYRQERTFIDEKILYTIGATSRFESQRVAIVEKPDNMKIDPSKVYAPGTLAVIDFEFFADTVSTAIVTEESIVAAVRSFRDKLQERLGG